MPENFDSSTHKTLDVPGQAMSTSDLLVDAMMNLVAREGMQGTSVRKIARAAGVTEAVLYRHFANKDAMIREAFEAVVSLLCAEREEMLASDLSSEKKVHEWVATALEAFDRQPESFAFVFLSAHTMPEGCLAQRRRIGLLFESLLESAQLSGDLPEGDTTLQRMQMAGLIAGVARAVYVDLLPGPAADHAQACGIAAWRMLGGVSTNADH